MVDEPSPRHRRRIDIRVDLGAIILDWIVAIPLALGAYLLGSVPSAYVLVYLARGIDIRQVGSRNVGALNTFQQVGAWGGLLVLSADAGKGALAVLAPRWAGAPEWTVFLTSLLVVAGHNWPVFLGFRGGKGAAAILGVSLAFVPLLTLVALGPAVLTMALARNVVLGAAFGFILLNSLLLATEQPAGQVALCVSLTMVVTVSYVVGIREHVISSIKARRWLQLFTGLA